MNDPSEHNQPLEVGQSFDRAIEKKINDAYEKGWDECYQARVVPLLREKGNVYSSTVDIRFCRLC